MKPIKIQEIMKNTKNRKVYLFSFLLCGILLMLLPFSNETAQGTDSLQENVESYSIEREEQRLAAILSSIDGVGKCRVLLSVHNGAETVLAEDEGETVVLSGSGQQSPVIVQTRYPEIQGAIIVTGGCADPSVRFDILSSVMAYTGLGADRITICPIKE